MTVLHEDARARLLGYLTVDPSPWHLEWAVWRVRFQFDNATPETSYKMIAKLVRERCMSLCQRRAEAVDNVLYLMDFIDLRPVVQCYGSVVQGPGLIAAIQTRQAYEEAADLATNLAATTVSADTLAEREAMTLPDISWDVVGSGMSRVATATVLGQKVVVRHAGGTTGSPGGAEMWVVDVNARPACAQFRSRGDAISKMGIAMALRAYEWPVTAPAL